MPYIDRDKLNMAFTMLRFNEDGTLRHWDDRQNWCMSGQEVEDLINSIPTVDAVEVVRCKDCKHWVTVVDHKKAEYGLCDAIKALIGATPRDGFCYKGERKETKNE